MDIFTRNKFLLRLVYFLVFLNIFSLGCLWLQKRGNPQNPPPPGRENENVSSVLRKELHLTDEQDREFRKIRESFSSKEEELSRLIRDQRDSMNAEMFKENTDTFLLKDLSWKVALNEYQMELLRIAQAEQLKKVCTPEQMGKFRDLVREIRDYFQPDRKKPQNDRQ